MMPQQKSFHFTQWEYLIPLFTAIALIVACIIGSAKKYYWNDELYSYYLLADPSFMHMLTAFYEKINNSPPLYFLIGWLWTQGFGGSELSLRLFSSVGICVASGATWFFLRQVYGFGSASLGMLSVFSLSELILAQNTEARMYGLFLAVCALGVLLFLAISRTAKPSAKLIIAHTIVHVAIVQTHLFGLFYSAALAIALGISDRYRPVIRPKKFYLSFILSWISLVFYIPAFIHQADAGNPHSWVPIPYLKDLFNFFILFNAPWKNSFLGLAFLCTLAFVFQAQRLPKLRFEKMIPQAQENFSLLCLSYVFLIIPILTWLVSRISKPIFLDRYMIPSLIGLSIVIAHFIDFVITFLEIHFDPKDNQFLDRKPIRMAISVSQKTGFWLLIFALMLHPIFYAGKVPPEAFPGSQDNQYGNRNLPIVTQTSHNFMTRMYYSDERDRYFFILDWPSAIDPNSGLFGPQEYKHMQTFKTIYPQYFNQNVIESASFLNTYPRFLVLDAVDYAKACSSAHRFDDIHCPQWLERYILNNPGYKVTKLGPVEDRTLLLVESIHAAKP